MDGLKVNYYALILSILKTWTPEQSFLYLETGIMDRKAFTKTTKEEEQEMLWWYDIQGLTYKAIGEMFGMNHVNVFRKIQNAREETGL